MPVCIIEGPVLTKESKGAFIKTVLNSLVDAYQMPDDRVYINEYNKDNYGHTLVDKPGHDITVQKDNPRVVISIIAPPGLAQDEKRIMFRQITEAAGNAYGISNLRDILVFLNEHPIHNVASNGYIQTENPEFRSAVTHN